MIKIKRLETLIAFSDDETIDQIEEEISKNSDSDILEIKNISSSDNLYHIVVMKDVTLEQPIFDGRMPFSDIMTKLPEET